MSIPKPRPDSADCGRSPQSAKTMGNEYSYRSLNVGSAHLNMRRSDLSWLVSSTPNSTILGFTSCLLPAKNTSSNLASIITLILMNHSLFRPSANPQCWSKSWQVRVYCQQCISMLLVNACPCLTDHKIWGSRL